MGSTVEQSVLTLKKSEKTIDDWKNHDNIHFYDAFPLEEFRKVAEARGLDTGCDVDLAMSLVPNAQSLLEVGAGYGRVLNHLINKNFAGELYAIERNKKLMHWLTSQFENKVTLIHADLISYYFQRQFDAILWMWTGIIEHSRLEQPLTVSRLANCLSPNGAFIIDTIPLNEEIFNVTDIEEQNIIVETKYGNDYVYVPTAEQIKEYAIKANLQVREIIHYKTRLDQKRMLHILTH